MALNITSVGVQATSEPLHTFPDSKWEHFNSIMIPISVLGMVAFAVMHYFCDPYLSSVRRIRQIIGAIVLVYLFPLFLITVSNNDAMIGTAVAAAIVEIVIDSFLFRKNPQHRIYTRAGSRILFVSMCIFIGASVVTDEYNHIDYYGPVRVTDVKLEFNRPQQQIDRYDPKWYYYYQLEQTLEWGESWGCPSQESERWCAVNEDLYKNKCRVRIDCNGRPDPTLCDTVNCEGKADLTLWECATPDQKKKAFQTLLSCWVNTVYDEGLHMEDFYDKNFTRTVAPWNDPSNPHTVTRTVSCGKTCTAHDTDTPDSMANRAFKCWVVGGVMSLLGLSTLIWGIKHDRVVQQVAFRPVSARIVMRTVTTSVLADSDDLELASNMQTAHMPIAHAMPA